MVPLDFAMRLPPSEVNTTTFTIYLTSLTFYPRLWVSFLCLNYSWDYHYHVVCFQTTWHSTGHLVRQRPIVLLQDMKILLRGVGDISQLFIGLPPTNHRPDGAGKPRPGGCSTLCHHRPHGLPGPLTSPGLKMPTTLWFALSWVCPPSWHLMVSTPHPLFQAQKMDVVVPPIQGKLRCAHWIWCKIWSAISPTVAMNQRLADCHYNPAPDCQPCHRLGYPTWIATSNWILETGTQAHWPIWDWTHC